MLREVRDGSIRGVGRTFQKYEIIENTLCDHEHEFESRNFWIIA